MSISQPTQQNASSAPVIDNADMANERTTLVIVLVLIAGVLLLIALVVALTLIPAQTLLRTIGQQVGVQQEQISGVLTNQVESLFNVTANDLLSLAQHAEIQSNAPGIYPTARILLDELGKRRAGQITALVRVDTSGAPLYAWPETLNTAITNGQPLDWRIDAGVMRPIIEQGGVQLVKRTVGANTIYLLVSPVSVKNGSTEGLVVALDLKAFIAQSVNALQLPDATQFWLVDPDTTQVIYQRNPQPAWTAADNTLLAARAMNTQAQFPSADRTTVSAPIFTAFVQASSSSSRTPALTVALSRLSSEGQGDVYNTLNSLFVGGLIVVLIIVLMGAGLGRYMILQGNRRRLENQRRSTVRTLLEMSRALNSSLELPVVLNKILDELAVFMPHDSASVMLLDDDVDEPGVHVAAQRGVMAGVGLNESSSLPLRKVRGTREVVRSGKPVVINDTRSDPRWNATAGSQAIASWMGVPLRLREQAVGVLNINSSQINRFGSDDAALAEAFADQACVAIANARAHELQIRQYETELETAHAIQTSLMPTEVPPIPQIQIEAQSFPARHVSGDYYQYLLLPDGRLGVAVGDVSGKGIPAALLMAVITTSLREEALRHTSPAALLNQLNLNLLDRMQSTNMNSALLVALFDPATRHVELSNAGMVQPYVRTENGWEFVPVGGYPLGASIRSNYTARTVTLAPGAMLLFISDGVIEAQNREGEFFGFERLEMLLNETPPTISSAALVACILQAVRTHLQGLEAQDDITVVAMKSTDL